MALDDPRDVVEVVGYDPEWRSRFETEKALLEAAIGDLIVSLEHVGSTAVEGLIAKPVIDILAGVSEQSSIALYRERLRDLGYEYQWQEDEPERIYFRKGMPRTHHLHIVIVGSVQYWDHMLFRDYLISHPEIREEYGDLKRDLAIRFRNDREAYWKGKDHFIRSVLDRARSEMDS